MSECPQCHARLSAEELRLGRCRTCQASFASATPSSDLGTIDKLAAVQDPLATVDSVDPIPTPPPAATNVDTNPMVTSAVVETFVPGKVTAPSAQGMQTAELSPIVGTPAEGGKTARRSTDSDATIDSSQAPRSGRSTDVNLATIDSAALPADVEQRMSAAWREVRAQASPQMTIKSIAFDEGDCESSLVIQQRAIGRAAEGHVHTTDYDLIDVIGEGGVGVVYAARQASIDRQVAVKMLKPSTISDPVQQRKFLSEAVVTGELEHPGIIPIYDLGCNNDGTLFYSMKRVQGTPWLKVIRRKSLQENLEILLRVCDAVAFAHAKGVVHRDLKPENIMLGDFGEVLVLDWGLAMSLNDDSKASLINRISTLGGTPAYMAPEMATGPLEAIGLHSDIYLLGAILFECVTGRVPHQAASATACLREAARNNIVATEHRGDLMDIALRAMATDPRDRHPSVRDFRDAIRECLAHFESITLVERADTELQTARDKTDYQAFARALFGFEEAYELWSGNQRALTGMAACRLAYANAAYTKGDFELGLSLLAPDDPAQASLRRQITAAQAERDARRQRLRRAKQMMFGLAALVFVSIATGIVLVSLQKAEADRQRRIAETNETIAKQKQAEAIEQRGIAVYQRGQADEQRRIAVGQRAKAEYQAYVALIGLAAARTDENAFGPALELLNQCQPELRNWEWGRLKYLCEQETKRFAVPARVEAVAFDPSGQHVAIAARDGRVRIWDLSAKQAVAEHSLDEAGAEAVASAVGYSPTAPDWLAIGGNARSQLLKLWNWRTNETRIFPGHRDTVVSVAFSRDGSRLLTASMDNLAILWDVASGRPIQEFRGHEWWVWDAQFSPDESQIVTASQDGTVCIWSATTGQRLETADHEPMPFTGHQGAVYTACFSPDGSHVASAGYDQRVLLWKPAELRPFDYTAMLRGEASPPQPVMVMEGHRAPVRRVEFSADGQWLLSAGHDNTVKIWAARDGDVDGRFVSAGALLKTLRGHSGHVRSAMFSPVDRNSLVSGGYDQVVRLWNVRNYSEQRTVAGDHFRGHSDAVLAAAFSPGGHDIVTASSDRTAKTWNVENGQQTRSFREGHLYLASSGAYFPDGRRIATAAIDGSVSIWNAEKGTEILKLSGTGAGAALAVSPDGRWIVTGRDPAANSSSASPDENTEPLTWTIWNADHGQAVRSLGGHSAEVTVARFSADGNTIFTGDARGRGNLWNAHTGDLLHSLRWHTDRITAASFIAGRAELITASADHTVCRWDLSVAGAPKPSEDRVLKHPGGVQAIAVTADGLTLVSGCEDGKVRGWDVLAARQTWERALAAGSAVRGIDLSPDQRLLAVVDAERNAVHLWEFERPTAGAEVTLDLNAANTSVWSAAFAPDSRSLLTIGGNEARAWDLQGVELMSFQPHRTVASASYSPDGRQIVTAGWDRSARIWDVATGTPVQKLSSTSAGPQGGHEDHINSAEFSPRDNKLVLTASDDGAIKIWDVTEGGVRATLRGHSAGVLHAAFSHDAQRIVSSSRDGTARIWDAHTGKVLHVLTGHALAVNYATFSTDGRWIATAGEDATVRIWDAETGQERQRCAGHTASVLSVSFSPDGTRLLSGSSDRTAKLWDAAQGTEILTLRGHQQDVTSVTFARDGRAALTGSRDGSVIYWPAATW